MQKTLLALALGASALLSSSAHAGGEDWYDDFDVAAAAAKEAGKDLLVDFTGSDWCGWCIRLDKEVFRHAAFLEPARKEYVLVALDFPRGEEAKSKVPNAPRNDELRDKYEIRGFPTVLVMSPQGEVFASTGYRAGGPAAYVKHLREISASGRRAWKDTQRVLAAFTGAEGEAKLAAWEQVVALLETLDTQSPYAPRLAEAVRYALEFDPRNERGLKLRAVKALLAAGQADESIDAAARELDPENQQGLLELALQAQFLRVQGDASALDALAALDALSVVGFKDSALAFDLTSTAARWCAGPVGDAERCKAYVAAAKAIGSDDAKRMAALDELLQG